MKSKSVMKRLAHTDPAKIIEENLRLRVGLEAIKKHMEATVSPGALKMSTVWLIVEKSLSAHSEKTDETRYEFGDISKYSQIQGGSTNAK